MSQHILVPLDGSSNAENAIPYAGELARTFNEPLTFVHVVTDGEGTGDTSGNRERFARYVEEIVERFGLRDCGFSTLYLQGIPAEQILDEAARSSFVVLASHGRSGFRATFIGSVADKIVRGTTVPVLVVPGVGRPAKPELTPTLVALDGSDEAERGLSMARRLAHAAAGHLLLLRACSLPRRPGLGFSYYPEVLPDAPENEASEYLDQVADKDDEKIVVHADAAEAVRSVAARYDAKLVVMTATGKGLAGRLGLGSTTDRVLHSLHRPLMVIPAKGTA